MVKVLRVHHFASCNQRDFKMYIVRNNHDDVVAISTKREDAEAVVFGAKFADKYTIQTITGESKMTELFEEIDFLETILIAMQEGASDEKRMAMNAIENRITRKTKMVKNFENEYQQ